MYKVRELLSGKLNKVRLIQLSIVMVVVIMLSFAVWNQEEDKDRKENKESKSVLNETDAEIGEKGYDCVIKDADYCIIVDADNKEIYVTTKWTDETDDKDRTETASNMFTIEDAILEAKNDSTTCDGSENDRLVKLSTLSTDVSLGNSTFSVETKNALLNAIKIYTTEEGTKITIDSLYFSTSLGNSFLLRAGNTSGGIPDGYSANDGVDNGISVEYDENNKKNTSELCYVEGMENGNSDKYNGVRLGCGIYIKGNATLEFIGENLIEIDDTAGRGGDNPHANAGKIEACYGIYGTEGLDLVEGDNGKLNIEFDSMPYYNPNESGGSVFQLDKVYINMFNYAVYCYGVYSNKNMTVNCDICVAATRDRDGADIGARKRLFARGFYGLVVQKGDIVINKGNIDIINDTEIVVYSSTVSSEVTSKKGVASDSFAFFRGLNVQGQGDIKIQRINETPVIRIMNKPNSTVEFLMGISTNKGNVEIEGSEVYVINEGHVRAYAELSFDDITANLSGLGEMAFYLMLGVAAGAEVFDTQGFEYETYGGLYGINIVDNAGSVTLDSCTYEVDSYVGEEDLPNKYIFDLYGIHSYGGISINNSKVDIDGYAESSAVGLYSVESAMYKNSNINIELELKKSSWELNPTILEGEKEYGDILKLATKQDKVANIDATTFFKNIDGICFDYAEATSDKILDIINCNVNVKVDGVQENVTYYETSLDDGTRLGPLTDTFVSQNSNNAITLPDRNNVYIDTSNYKSILVDATLGNVVETTQENAVVKTFAGKSLGDTSFDKYIDLDELDDTERATLKSELTGTYWTYFNLLSFDKHFYRYYSNDTSNGDKQNKMYYVIDIDNNGVLDEILLQNDKSVIEGVDFLVEGWSISNNGLTLNGFNYDDAVGGGMLEVIGDASITVTGDNNTITAPVYRYKESDTSETDIIDFASYGIYSKSNLTLNGSGSITISKENTNNYVGNSCFIPLVSAGNVIVDSGTYNLVSNNYGLQSKGDTLELNDGTVNVTAARGLYSAGDFIVDGGALDVSTMNSGVTVARDIDINSGTVLLYGGNVAIEQTAESPKLDICNAYVTLQGNVQAISTSATFDIHAYVEGSLLYDGMGAVQIVDINDTFYDEVFQYYEYNYFNLEPAIMTVNISWGDLKYTGTETWDPERLVYNCNFSAEDDNDKISVTNVGEASEEFEESNIPVVARISCAGKDFINTHGIKYNVTGKIDNTEVVATRKNLINKSIIDGYQIDVGKELIYTLGLSVDPYSGKSLTNLTNGTQQSMGDVTITLSDY